MKVLVVDDERSKLGILIRIFRPLYEVEYAMDGECALQKVAQWRPDVVLLDVMMPGMSGYEVCRALRGEHANRHLKVVMVTGRATSEDRREGMAAGADAYVKLPFDEDELIGLVSNLVRLKSAEEQLERSGGSDDGRA